MVLTLQAVNRLFSERGGMGFLLNSKGRQTFPSAALFGGFCCV